MSDAQLEDAVRILGRLPPGPELSHAYAHRANQRVFRGGWKETLRLAEEALALAEQLAAEEDMVRSLNARGLARLELGDPRGADDDLHRALQVSLDRGLSYSASIAYVNLTVTIHFNKGWRAAPAHLEAGIEYARQHGVAGAAPASW